MIEMVYKCDYKLVKHINNMSDVVRFEVVNLHLSTPSIGICKILPLLKVTASFSGRMVSCKTPSDDHFLQGKSSLSQILGRAPFLKPFYAVDSGISILIPQGAQKVFFYFILELTKI